MSILVLTLAACAFAATDDDVTSPAVPAEATAPGDAPTTPEASREAETATPADGDAIGDDAGSEGPALRRRKHRHERRRPPELEIEADDEVLAEPPPRVRADAQPAVASEVEALPPKEVGQWRVEVRLAPQEILGGGVRVFGPVQVEVSTSLERNLGDLLSVLPGSSARIGLSFSSRRPALTALDLLEVELGVAYQYPHDGLWGVLFPYVRLDALGAWAALRVNGGQVDTFVPGVAGALGVRAASPWINGQVRLYGLVEGQVAYRAALAVRLRGPSDADEPIRDPGVPLGVLSLSGYAVRLGAGVEF